MLIGSIGDIHGRKIWKHFVNDKSIDKWIFIGDYVDSFTIKDEDIYNNLLDIIQFKKNNYNKVILLLGNHDMAYIDSKFSGISGYRPSMRFMLQDIFEQNKRLFQMAYQHKDYLWTHAGITETWFNEHYYAFNRYNSYNPTNESIDAPLNYFRHSRYLEIYSDVGTRRGGTSKSGSPIWADKVDMTVDFLKNYNHIVGHTYISRRETIMDVPNRPGSVTFIDHLYHVDEYLITEVK